MSIIKKYNNGDLNVETLLLTSKLISVAGIIWGLMYCVFGMYFSSIFPFAYTFLMTIFIFMYHKGIMSIEKLLIIELFLILILPALLQWSVGTFNSSGVVVLWSILAPTGSLLFQNRERAMNWFLAFLVVIFILVFYEVFLYNDSFQPPDISMIFLVMNITAISSILFFSLSFFVKESRRKEQKINTLLEIESKAAKELSIKTTNLKSLLIEKDIMLKEIHHRVKNNLQVITSLLSLQNNFIEETKVKAIFQKSQNRINSMAMIHEMLYHSEDLSKINYGFYCKKLINQITEMMLGQNNEVELILDVKEIYLNIDTSIALGLIINEIVTNAVKYGLIDNKVKIMLQLTKENKNTFQMLIGDSGIGFNKEINIHNPNTLGMSLIYKLAKQLNGQIKKDDSKPGANFILKFEEI